MLLGGSSLRNEYISDGYQFHMRVFDNRGFILGGRWRESHRFPTKRVKSTCNKQASFMYLYNMYLKMPKLSALISMMFIILYISQRLGESRSILCTNMLSPLHNDSIKFPAQVGVLLFWKLYPQKPCPVQFLTVARHFIHTH